MTGVTRTFRVSGNNKGLRCPFTPILCQEGYCQGCQIYLNWQERREKVVICGWCGREMRRERDFGRSVLLVGICNDCELRNVETGKNIRYIKQ